MRRWDEGEQHGGFERVSERRNSRKRFGPLSGRFVLSLVPSLGYASNDRKQRIRTVIPDEFLLSQTTTEICPFEHEEEA